MTHPLDAYFDEAKDGHIPDEKAKEDITGLINDPEVVKEVCQVFRERKNSDTTCFTVGKVYDVQGESYGCVTILSDDVSNVIGEDGIESTQESLNYVLITTYLEFRRLCKGTENVYEAWDDYLDLILSKNYLALYENGVRTRLIYNSRIGETSLPLVVFIVYLDYGAVYG